MNSSSVTQWRTARAEDELRIVEMCLALNREDPGATPVEAAQIARTLQLLRSDRHRGRAVVLEMDGRIAGYALLIAYWSNERGGEVCVVDEVFVDVSMRSKGGGTALFHAIERGDLWSPLPVSIELVVSARNARARQLYERLGFEVSGTSMSRVLRASVR